jgi:hypothetical protein
MDMTLGTWRVSIQRIPPTSAELAALHNAAAHYWPNALRRLGFLRVRRPVRACGTTVRWGRCRPARAHWIVASARRPSVWRRPRSWARPYGSRGSTSPHRCSTKPSTRWMRPACPPSCADVCDLPFADQLFDLVVSAYTLEHVGDPRAGLREMARVMRPGAALLVVVTRRGIGGTLLGLKYRNAGSTQPHLPAGWRTQGWRMCASTTSRPEHPSRAG